MSKSLDRPFVAVNGGKTVEQIKGIAFSFASEFRSLIHTPVLGFLVSFSTLNGSNTFNDSRYPKLKDLPTLLRNVNGDAHAVISYKTDFAHFYRDVESILSYEDIYKNGLCNGIDLNIAWPSLDEILRVRERFSDLKIIMRVSTEANGRQLDVKEVADRAEAYLPVVNYILIDKPEGHKPDHSIELYGEMDGRGVRCIGFCGAIGSDSAAHLVRSLRGNPKNHGFSIVVQDAVRSRENTPGNSISESTLDMGKVNSFLRSTTSALYESQVLWLIHQPA
ncbi:MAG: hypothetical protein ABSE71_01455 [Candidatus Micrarchaeaceae archaeon]|jgi:hypothetical protein|nr:hypothetical protein [Candidatus Micrarchaeota archaeon]